MTDDIVRMIPTSINNTWTLNLPEHRAARPEWGFWTDDIGTEHYGWEVERLESMARNIGPGDIVYDVGTEEGDISALIQTWIGRGDGGVCLFEPNDLVWPNVKAIWEANELKPPISCFTGFCGVTDADDVEGSLYGSYLGAGEHHFWPPSASGPVISDHGFCNITERPDIPIIALDSFALYVAPPTVITIDVEGAELLVLTGADQILKELRPLVYCSVHPQFMQDMYQMDTQHLYDYMGFLGYRSKILEIDHETHVVFWHPEGREVRL